MTRNRPQRSPDHSRHLDHITLTQPLYTSLCSQTPFSRGLIKSEAIRLDTNACGQHVQSVAATMSSIVARNAAFNAETTQTFYAKGQACLLLVQLARFFVVVRPSGLGHPTCCKFLRKTRNQSQMYLLQDPQAPWCEESTPTPLRLASETYTEIADYSGEPKQLRP